MLFKNVHVDGLNIRGSSASLVLAKPMPGNSPRSSCRLYITGDRVGAGQTQLQPVSSAGRNGRIASGT